MLNRIVITGRLTRDPEHSTTAKTNTSTAKFTIAVDDPMKDANGKQITSFITVIVWNALADSVAKSLRKGALVGVDGRIRQRSWERKDGTKASTLEIIANQVEFLEPKGSRDIPNEDLGFESDVENESTGVEFGEEDDLDIKSKNLDALDPTNDDVPF